MNQIYKKKSFVIFRSGDCYIIHNTEKTFEEGHTHIKNVNTAKYIVSLAAKKTLPKHLSDYLLVSLLRLTNDDKYKEHIEQMRKKQHTKKKGVNKIIITGMAHFESVCKKKLVEWYNKYSEQQHTVMTIDLSNVFVVWSCKTLQNYKALLSTTVIGDGIYAEYTFNGDKGELYEDVYKKLTNTCITEE